MRQRGELGNTNITCFVGSVLARPGGCGQQLLQEVIAIKSARA